MYAKVESGQIIKYPFNYSDLQAQYPGASVPVVWSEEFLASENLRPVIAATQPAFNPLTQKVVEGTPFFNQATGQCEQQWVVVDLTADERVMAMASLQNSIVAQVQDRLDAFARTRNYDGILSACTYATSTVPKFQAEGQYCVNARDATWSSLYAMLAEVQAGTRPVPTSYADIEPELPPLVWPQ